MQQGKALAGAGDAGVDEFARQHAGVGAGQHQGGVQKLRTLAFVHRHGKRGFHVRQAAAGHAAQRVAIQKIHAQRGPRVECGQGDAHVAVEHAQRAVVARDHGRAADKPLAARFQKSRLGQGKLDRQVQAARAPVALVHRAHQAKAVKSAQDRRGPGAMCSLRVSAGCAGPGLHESQVVGVAGWRIWATMHRQAQHGLHLVLGAGVQRACGVICQQGQRGSGVPGVDGCGQLADLAAKTATVAQHYGLLGECGRGAGVAGPVAGAGGAIGATGQEFRREAATGQSLRVAGGGSVVLARACVPAQVAQYRTGFDRGQLVFVAQQNQLGAGRQRLHQGGHHFQVHHGRLVHDDDVHVQWRAGVEAELARVGPRTQERVQRARRAYALGKGGQVQPGALRAWMFPRCSLVWDGPQARAQFLQRAVNRLAQARGRLAGGRGQGHAQALGLGRHGKQERQQARGGIGFAGAGAAGNDGEVGAQGHGAGHFLPVHGVGGGCVLERSGSAGGRKRRGGSHHLPACRGRVKQPVQPLPGGSFVHGAVLGCALPQGTCELLLLQPVAAQIKQGRGCGAGQHQRLALVALRGLILVFVEHHAHQAAGAQRVHPQCQRSGQFKPQRLQRGLRCGRPVQQGLRVIDDRCQWQTGVAAPLHLRQERGADQQRGAGVGFQLGQQRGQRAV